MDYNTYLVQAAAIARAPSSSSPVHEAMLSMSSLGFMLIACAQRVFMHTNSNDNWKYEAPLGALLEAVIKYKFFLNSH